MSQRFADFYKAYYGYRKIRRGSNLTLLKKNFVSKQEKINRKYLIQKFPYC